MVGVGGDSDGDWWCGCSVREDREIKEREIFDWRLGNLVILVRKAMSVVNQTLSKQFEVK